MMKKNINISSKYAKQNRIYNSKMRDSYYEESTYLFRKIMKYVNSKSFFKEQELLKKLYTFLRFLETSLSYAKSSVYYDKNNKTLSYSKNYSKSYNWEIMQEEIMLIFLLEEQIFSVKYIINHLETSIKIQFFAHENKNDANASHILLGIDEFNKDTNKNLQHFYYNIEKKYKIGSKLFGIIKDRQYLNKGEDLWIMNNVQDHSE